MIDTTLTTLIVLYAALSLAYIVVLTDRLLAMRRDRDNWRGRASCSEVEYRQLLRELRSVSIPKPERADVES